MTLAKLDAAGFVAVGVPGLVVTQLVWVMLLSRLGAHVALARVPTVVALLFVSLCQRGLVFAATPRS